LTSGRTASRPAFLLPIACTLLSLARLPFGCDLAHGGAGDEGFYLSSAARYIYGDRPFIDEHYTTPISFDLVNFALRYFLPIDILLAWRVCGLILTAAALGLLAFSLREWMPRGSAPSLYSVCILFSPFNLWTPNYKNLSLLLLCLSIAFVAGACRVGGWRQRLLASISACCFCGAVVCYVTLLVVLALPLTYLICSFRAPQFATGRRIAIPWLLTVVAATALACVAVTQAGLTAQIVHNLGEKQLYPQYAGSLASRLYQKLIGHALWSELVLCVPLAFLSAIGVTHRNRLFSRVSAFVAITGMGTLTWKFATAGADYGTLSPWLFLLNVSLLVGLLTLSTRIQGLRGTFQCPGTWLVALSVTVGLVFALSASLVSSYIAELSVCSWLLWTAIVFKAAGLTSPRWQSNTARWLLLSTLAVTGTISLLHLWTWTYGDAPPWRLRHAFAAGKLAGIISTDARVREISRLNGILSDTVPPGDFVLAYGGFWGLNWLTDTRPPLATTIIALNHPPERLLRYWLPSMIDQHREPAVIVTSVSVSGLQSSLETYIAQRYQPAERVGQFEVWLRKGDVIAPRY
jgi:hypothetical protein